MQTGLRDLPILIKNYCKTTRGIMCAVQIEQETLKSWLFLAAFF